jgi:hypothetical protein
MTPEPDGKSIQGNELGNPIDLPPCDILFGRTAESLTIQPYELLYSRAVEQDENESPAAQILEYEFFQRLLSLTRVFHVIANAPPDELDWISPQLGTLKKNLATSAEGIQYLEELNNLYKDKTILRITFKNNPHLSWENYHEQSPIQLEKILQNKLQPLILLACASREWKGYIHLDLTDHGGDLEQIINDFSILQKYGWNAHELTDQINSGDAADIITILQTDAVNHNIRNRIDPPLLFSFLDKFTASLTKRDNSPPIIILDGLDADSLNNYGVGPDLGLVESDTKTNATLLIRTNKSDPRLDSRFGSVWAGRMHQISRLKHGEERLAVQFGSPWPGRMLKIQGVSHFINEEDSPFPQNLDADRFRKVYNAFFQAIQSGIPKIAVIGPREFGKTTFLRVLSLAPEVRENILVTRIDENGLWATFTGLPTIDYLKQVNNLPKYIIVDEAGFQNRSAENIKLISKLTELGIKLIYVYPSHATPDQSIPAIQII